MPPEAQRGLDREFLDDLQRGRLSPLRERVIADRTLCLELRANYINVYYRGGNLMKVRRGNTGYHASFDRNYFKGAAPSFELPTRLRDVADVETWLGALPYLKQAIDLFLGKQSKEREIQQMLLLDNNVGQTARSTDYYVCDIEYANAHGRFDLVAVHWPSTGSERKK